MRTHSQYKGFTTLGTHQHVLHQAELGFAPIQFHHSLAFGSNSIDLVSILRHLAAAHNCIPVTIRLLTHIFLREADSVGNAAISLRLVTTKLEYTSTHH